VILRISTFRATKLPGNPRFIKAFHRENVTFRFGEPEKPSEIALKTGEASSFGTSGPRSGTHVAPDDTKTGGR